MVWPPILMECSVTEDSSFGGGGVGSAGFSFSTVLVSFSCVRSCATAANGVRLSSKVVVTAVRRVSLDILCVHSGADLRIASRRVYTPQEREVKEARITRTKRFVRGTPSPGFPQVLILKEVKIACFDILLQVFILKVDTSAHADR